MRQRALSVFLAVMLLAVPAMRTQAPNPSPNAPAEPGTITASSICGAGATYDQLTSAPRTQLPNQIIPYGTAPVELTFTRTEFSDRPVDAKTAASPAFCAENATYFEVDVSAAGEGYSVRSGAFESQGGGEGKLPAEAFARLESLMDNLPDDGHRVPTANHRIVVRVQRNGGETVRLYDNAQLPDEIIEMIRLTAARIKIQPPNFQPDKVWRPEEVKSLDLPETVKSWGIRNPFIASPDGSVGVLHDFATKTLTVYRGSDWPEHGMPDQSRIIRVLQEFWQPTNVYGGYAVGGEFSPDGRYLLVRWGARIGAMLYDTATWEPVTDPRLFPQNLKEYLPSSDWDLGVAVTDEGETLIWDQQSHRILSKLPGLGEFEAPPVVTNQQGQRVYTTPRAEIQSAAFSPDHTRVAIYSGPNNNVKLRLSVWDIESGQKLRDLLPVEWASYPSGQPLWWNNGRWVLAHYASQDSRSGIGLWDVETGYFKGTLDVATEKCDTREDLVVSGSRLLQRCFLGKDQQDKVLEWTIDGIRKQMDSAANPLAADAASNQKSR
jgi:hypothetical protein